MIKKIKQNAEEAYFKVKKESELPVANLMYTTNYIKTGRTAINPFNSIYVDFSNDNDSIDRMIKEAIYCGKTFMFFNNSNAGEKYFKGERINIKPKPEPQFKTGDFIRKITKKKPKKNILKNIGVVKELDNENRIYYVMFFNSKEYIPIPYEVELEYVEPNKVETILLNGGDYA